MCSACSEQHTCRRALGHGLEELCFSAYKAELRSDDPVLLCTDGLTEGLSDEQISAILRPGESEEAAYRRRMTRDHSCRRASIGSRLAACRAGYSPNTMPTDMLTPNASARL
jgi:hypothetical protein